MMLDIGVSPFPSKVFFVIFFLITLKVSILVVVVVGWKDNNSPVQVIN